MSTKAIPAFSVFREALTNILLLGLVQFNSSANSPEVPFVHGQMEPRVAEKSEFSDTSIALINLKGT